MKARNGVIDTNDLVHCFMEGIEPIDAICAPVRNGVPHPETTLFLLPGGYRMRVIHIKPVYYKHKNGEWRPLSEVTVHHGNRQILLNEKWTDIEPAYLAWLDKRQKVLKGTLGIPLGSTMNLLEQLVKKIPIPFSATTNVFYPDPSPESTTFDGYLQDTIAGGRTWSTIRALAQSVNKNDSGAWFGFVYYGTAVTVGKYDNFMRNILLFNSATIGSETITSASIQITVSGKGNSANFPVGKIAPTIVLSDPGSDTAIALTDFATFTLTDQGSIAYNDVVADDATYNALTFSTFANINKSGISKFGIVGNADLVDTDPAPTVQSTVASITGNSADTAGTSKDPKLVVVSEAAASPTEESILQSPSGGAAYGGVSMY